MDIEPQPCRNDLIERFLDDRLDTEEMAALENHLDSCSSCRRELEGLAAGENWWSQARDCLTPADSGFARGQTSDLTPVAVEGESTHDIRSSLAAIKPYLAPTDDPRMMGRVGPYEVLGVIGSGGNGVVLKGFDPALNRYVAVKLLSPQLAASAAARRRFSREAQAAAAVVHDNVTAIHAVSETQGLPYLVMPYLRGPSLEKRLRVAGPLALEEILRVGLQVAAGLGAAHAQGLVHRDIKPANILLEEGVERVKITDFGLARAADDASLTRSGVIAGTPQYMSPEQARGEPVDHRTDLFSLGCVLYTACTGRPPFRAPTSYGVLRKICENEPRPVREINASIPVWLARIIDRLLAKDPARRYSSAAEVADLLERCLAHVQQPAASIPPELLEPAGNSGPAAGTREGDAHSESRRSFPYFGGILPMAGNKKLALVLGIVFLVLAAVSAGGVAAIVFIARTATATGGFPPPAGPPKVIRTLGPADEPISANAKWGDSELQITANEAGVQRLFEVTLPRVEQSMITYRFRIQTEGLKSSVYPEMWCRVEGLGEAFSRGLDQKVIGSNKWTTVQIPFYLDKGQFADLLKLNLVFEGPGSASLRDIEVVATPLQARAR